MWTRRSIELGGRKMAESQADYAVGWDPICKEMVVPLAASERSLRSPRNRRLVAARDTFGRRRGRSRCRVRATRRRAHLREGTEEKRCGAGSRFSIHHMGFRFPASGEAARDRSDGGGSLRRGPRGHPCPAPTQGLGTPRRRPIWDSRPLSFRVGSRARWFPSRLGHPVSRLHSK